VVSDTARRRSSVHFRFVAVSDTGSHPGPDRSASHSEPSSKFDDDDWFSETGPSSVDERRQPTGADPAEREPSWLEDPAAEPEQQPTTASPFARRRLVALAVAVIVLIAIVVIALIAFGGGNSSTPTEPTTTNLPTTTTPAATPPANPPSPTPPPTPAVILPAGILRPGATGAEVKTVQRALAQAGHSPGPIDGIYGPNTEQAVAAFQRSAGIPADGHYGPQTKQALEQKITTG
jgi:Putative peptidoglycan binding domain